MSANLLSQPFRAIFTEVEEAARSQWAAEKVDSCNLDSDNPKHRYVLGMFPYPSGNAHMGHVRVYTISDVIARVSRLRGYNVLHPLGWDAFGLPAENAAIQNKVDPAVWTAENIRKMKDEQLNRVGFSFDFDHETNSASPEYYKWTQWLFQELYDYGLVYRAEGWVNWDPVDETVLANEQVIDGCGWRSGVPVERRLLPQWYIRITKYAQALWDGLESLKGHWSDEAIAVQRGWIGRSEGVEIDFPVVGPGEGGDQAITVYTTRADTLFGVTSITLAPEHPLAVTLASAQQKQAVAEYAEWASGRGEVERESAERTGVALGRSCRHPLTGEVVPIYVSEYVLGGYGSGAIMNVPAHDARDFSFAISEGLPVKQVILPQEGAAPVELTEAYTDPGFMHGSGEFDGMRSDAARQKIIDFVAEKGLGKRKVNFRLRDWLISRQRFWGAPIPMIHSEKHGWGKAPDLPVMLPSNPDFSKGSGSAMALAPGFVDTTWPGTDEPARRETDTMDTFMCSSWYAWRFLDAKNNETPFSKNRADKWMPIDYYVGGLEHASQHLIYFRFISRFLHDIGRNPEPEPVRNFLDNGMVRLGGAKMSKSKGNVVVPNETIDKYGADALRLYILADTPLRRDIDWNDAGIEGKQRFLSQIWDLCSKLADGAVPTAPDIKTPRERAAMGELAKLSIEVAADIEERRGFHNAVARLHGFFGEVRPLVNAADPAELPVMRHVMAEFTKVLGSFAPHMAEALWRGAFGGTGSVFLESWPQLDPTFMEKDEVTYSIQVNGKLRGTIDVAADAAEADVVPIARAHEKVAPHLEGKAERRVIFVPKRLINFVV